MPLNENFCPYEFLTEFDMLEQNFLPEYESFYSNLKGENVLETEYKEFIRRRGKDLSIKRPKTGYENYEHIKKTWADRGFKTMLDYLEYYNCLDVQPP